MNRQISKAEVIKNKKQFIKEFKRTGSKSNAVDSCGVSERTIFYWLKKDEIFDRAAKKAFIAYLSSSGALK